MTNIVERLWKGSRCIYITVEKAVADDISAMMGEAANEIEQLQEKLDEVERLLKSDGDAEAIIDALKHPRAPDKPKRDLKI